MSKYSCTELWERAFGSKQQVYDYAGRLMKKAACGDPHSACHPTVDHIRPLSQGGSDVPENIVICHRDTNAEKADRFPSWRTNGRTFHAVRIRGKRTGYRIEEG